VTQLSPPPPETTFGLPGRRYPFVAETPEEAEVVSRECGRAINSTDRMLRGIINRYAPIGMKWHCREDLAQDCRMHLWKSSMAKFDAHKCIKLSTFMHVCMVNYVTNRLITYRNQVNRSMSGKVPSTILFSQVGDQFDLESHDSSYEVDTALRHLREEIPFAAIMHPAPLRTLMLWLDHPEKSTEELAQMAGYSRETYMQTLRTACGALQGYLEEVGIRA
jgi:RNA polymerase sigma factor (sigma-70 family)